MKKTLLVVLLSASIFILTACSQSGPSRAENTYVGVVGVSGSYFSLQTDDDNFKIRSTFLDLTPYLNKKVKIHGQFSKEVFFVDDVKPATN
ncbi:hypothetical protein HY345_04000 [Candidatus Microgenomates bacterium]|nr:hypothetical protein [Candidatus Microgenomates bacterium]